MGDLNRKEEAIRWLTQELRSLRLAPDINGCDMQPHWQEQIDILEICLEAVRACHIGDTSKMVPLTQADIETMHFERVWIDYGEDREDGVVLYGRLYSIDTLDGAGFEDLLLAATGHGGENIDRSSGEYTIYRCQPGSRTGYGDGMVPLTLEQLREMDGKPVWVMEQPDWGHWELSEDADDYFSDRDPSLYGLAYPDPEGKGGIHKLGWIAYAYPPPHIDREAWVSVEEKLPDAEEEVRLLCVTSWGRHYQCQGFYVPPGTYRDDSGYSWDWECCEEYNEERDDYLVNPGWYESIHNWDEYSACGIADKVTNWMPLPEEPEDMEKRARGIKKDGT